MTTNLIKQQGLPEYAPIAPYINMESVETITGEYVAADDTVMIAVEVNEVPFDSSQIPTMGDVINGLKNQVKGVVFDYEPGFMIGIQSPKQYYTGVGTTVVKDFFFPFPVLSNSPYISFANITGENQEFTESDLKYTKGI